jgi:hypothetical protein
MMKRSIYGDEFIKFVVDSLAQSRKLVVWHQIPWAGGAQEWYLISHLDEGGA